MFKKRHIAVLNHRDHDSVRSLPDILVMFNQYLIMSFPTSFLKYKFADQMVLMAHVWTSVGQLPDLTAACIKLSVHC